MPCVFLLRCDRRQDTRIMAAKMIREKGLQLTQMFDATFVVNLMSLLLGHTFYAFCKRIATSVEIRRGRKNETVNQARLSKLPI